MSNEAIHYRNPTADLLLSAFNRWLKSPSSLMYDPAIARTVHALMKKVWLQLLAELKALRCTLVYASMSSLIMCTGKTLAQQAFDYARSLLQFVRAKPLFTACLFEAGQAWQTLLFMDSSNYSGLLLSPTPPPPPAMDIDSQSEEQKQQLEREEEARVAALIDKHWNMALYLPELARTNFEAVAAEFMIRPYLFAQRQNRLFEAATAKPLNAAASSLTQEAAIAQAREEKEKQFQDWLYTFIRTDLGQKLLAITRLIRAELPGDQGAGATQSSEFPVLPGSHLPLHNPALEFVKQICRIISVEFEPPVNNVGAAASGLRENLLQLLGVRPFSEQAQFADPCLSFMLNDIMCHFCNTSADVDLCRDALLTECAAQAVALENEGKFDQAANMIASGFVCRECRQPWDLDAIEATLVQEAIRMSTSYQIQDVACIRCHQVEASTMQQYCSCSGSLRVVEPVSSFMAKLRPFLNIAQAYHFMWLQEVCTWLLNGTTAYDEEAADLQQQQQEAVDEDEEDEDEEKAAARQYLDEMNAYT